MKKRFESLDVFRGVAALIVAIYHFSKGDGTLGNIPIIAGGHRFVDFFFLLSGFIIYYNYQNVTTTEQRRTFITKRFFRLYPLHLFMLMLFFLFEVAKAGFFQMGLFKNPAFSTNSIPKLIQHLFMLQGIARNSEDFSWNYPSWSISTELFAYLAFALIIIPLNRIPSRFRTGVLLLVSSLALVGELIGAGYADLILKCVYGFFLGSAVERIYNLVATWNISSQVYTMLEITILTTTSLAICYLPQYYAWVLSPLYALVVLIFAPEKGIVSKLITNRATIWLGSLSYSIYMTHALVANVMKVLLVNVLKVSDSVYNASSVIFLVTVILFSSFTYRYIEKQGRASLRSMLT